MVIDIFAGDIFQNLSSYFPFPKVYSNYLIDRNTKATKQIYQPGALATQKG